MSKVSIVLPVLNGEEYLREAVDSILEQTYQDWELIIVDNCSSDSTPEIIREYVAKDSRIKSVRNEKTGKIPFSLNRGFSLSSGDFLTWTSDDNVYYPDAIGEMVSFLESNPDENFVYADMDYIDENGRVRGQSEENDITRMYYNQSVGACILYTRKVYEEIGDYNDEFYLVEDYEYFLRVLEHYGKIGHINKRLYAYRVYEQSLSVARFIDQKKILNEGIRKPHFDYLFSKLEGNSGYLFGLYADMLFTDSVSADMLKKFERVFPEINRISSLENEKNIIIYGAGDFGKRAYNILADRVECFADRSENKIGTMYCGKPVISPDEALKKSLNQPVLIALESDLVYGVLKYFLAGGGEKIGLLQKIFHEMYQVE